MESKPFRIVQIALRKLKGLLFFILVALLLDVALRHRIIQPLYFPPFSQIFDTFVQLNASGVLPGQVAKSLLRMSSGYLLAAAVMIPLGVLIGTHRRLFLAFDPLLEVLRPLPPPAIIPVAMLFFGIGDGMKVFVVCFACSFPILTNSIDGSRSIHPLFTQTARTLGLSRYSMLTRVILPAASPQIMSGLRTAVPICLIVTILSEMIGGEDGIGHWTLRMQRTFSIPEMYSGVLMTGFLGYLLNRVFLEFENRWLAWHEGWKRATR